MKFLSLSAVALLVCAFSAPAQVPVGPGSVKLGKVTANLVKTPEYQITGGQNKRYTLGSWLEMEVEFETAPETIPELTFKYIVQIAGKLLTGEVTHINIPKGREHFSVMYVAPRTLERLAGGKAPTGSIADNVWVEVSYQGQKLDVAAIQRKAIPNVQQVTGLILNKNETPFAPLYYDRYEAIKPTR